MTTVTSSERTTENSTVRPQTDARLAALNFETVSFSIKRIGEMIDALDDAAIMHAPDHGASRDKFDAYTDRIEALIKATLALTRDATVEAQRFAAELRSERDATAPITPEMCEHAFQRLDRYRDLAESPAERAPGPENEPAFAPRSADILLTRAVESRVVRRGSVSIDGRAWTAPKLATRSEGGMVAVALPRRPGAHPYFWASHGEWVRLDRVINHDG